MDDKKLEYVKVVWIDHVGYSDSGWRDLDEDDLADMAKGYICITVGPLLLETDKAYVVGHTVCQNGHISGAMAIQKVLVKEFYQLKSKKDKK